MGQARRKPLRLAEKLLAIRERLGLSQNDLISRMNLAEDLTQARISAYERGAREPPLMVLLRYARTANVLVETLIDDELDLPVHLPSVTRHEGVRQAKTARSITRSTKSIS